MIAGSRESESANAISTPIGPKIPIPATGAMSEVANEANPTAVVRLVRTIEKPECRSAWINASASLSPE